MSTPIVAQCEGPTWGGERPFRCLPSQISGDFIGAIRPPSQTLSSYSLFALEFKTLQIYKLRRAQYYDICTQSYATLPYTIGVMQGHLCRSLYNGGSSTTLTVPASVCLTYSVSSSFSWVRFSLEPYTLPAASILALILSPRRDPNAYSSLTAWSPSSSSSVSRALMPLMLGSGAGEDGLRAELGRRSEGAGLTDTRGLAYGCALHVCRSGSGPEFPSCPSWDGSERDWVRM
jgi:hypothetical protein